MNEINCFVLRNEEYLKTEAVNHVIESDIFLGIALNLAAVLEGNTRQFFLALIKAMNRE